jgi:hypothetical protein
MLKRSLRWAARHLKSWLSEAPPADPAWLLESDFVSDHFNYRLMQLRRRDPTLRTHFAWGLLSAGHQAKALQISRISGIEFGVAGGNGLLALESIAQQVAAIYGIDIDVYGFDTGVGLPKPTDYRDLPNLYRESGFRMDVSKLRSRLTRARLVLGDVADTLGEFVASCPAPVGFISVDVDLYSSTTAVFKLLDADHACLLPRVYVYCDDVLGETFSEFTGERLAIAEFNAAHNLRKISPIYGLRYFLRGDDRQEAWPDQMYIAHVFDHPLYGIYAGTAKDAGGWTDLR